MRLMVRLKPDFSKAIQLDIWIARPGAYCYQIEYEPLPPWDPLDEKPQSTKNKLTRVGPPFILKLMMRNQLKSTTSPSNLRCVSTVKSYLLQDWQSNLSPRSGWDLSANGQSSSKCSPIRATICSTSRRSIIAATAIPLTASTINSRLHQISFLKALRSVSNMLKSAK